MKSVITRTFAQLAISTNGNHAASKQAHFLLAVSLAFSFASVSAQDLPSLSPQTVAEEIQKARNTQHAALLKVRLANSELRAKNYQRAITLLQDAIAKEAEPRPYAGPEVSSFAISCMEPLSALAAAGHFEKAIETANLMAEKADAIYGRQTFEYMQCLLILFRLYASAEKFEDADRYLGQTLALDPRKFELGRECSGPALSLDDMAFALAMSDHLSAYGMASLKKILAEHRAMYGDDDFRTMVVLTKLGIAEVKQGLLLEAERHFKEAMMIKELYGIDYSNQYDPVRKLIELLTRENKADELQQLQARMKDKRAELAHFNLSSYKSGIGDLRKYYEYWHDLNPYSRVLIGVEFKLIEEAVKNKDWPTIKTIAPECITALAHNTSWGDCLLSASPAKQKFYCFKYLILANLKMGEREEALKWLERAHREQSYVPLTEELLFLSQIEYACGNSKTALELCRQAEKTLPTDGKWNYYEKYVCEQYIKFGAAADIARIQNASPDRDKQIRNKYNFNYAALAGANLWLLGDEQLKPAKKKLSAKQQEHHTFAASFEGMSSSNKVRQSGKLMFICDKNVEQRLTSSKEVQAPLVMARPFLPALTAPAHSTALNGTTFVLKPGDYVANKMTIKNLTIPKPGRVRIFVKDNSGYEESKFVDEINQAFIGEYEEWKAPAALATSNGASINAIEPKQSLKPLATLELWYNGTDTIYLGDDTSYTGIIYAPNAVIRMGKGVQFTGAMVARSIFAGEGAKITYLPQLRDWKQN